MSDDDPEGAFNLVGSADDPQLEAADLELEEEQVEDEENLPWSMIILKSNSSESNPT